jgi:hypothetical protein
MKVKASEVEKFKWNDATQNVVGDVYFKNL